MAQAYRQPKDSMIPATNTIAAAWVSSSISRGGDRTKSCETD